MIDAVRDGPADDGLSRETAGRRGVGRLGPALVAALVMAAMFGVGVGTGIALEHRILHSGPSFARTDRADRPGFVPGAPMRLPPSVRDSADRGAQHRQGPRLDQFARSLDLTPAQKAAVDSVMAHEFAMVNAIREEMWPRMRAVVDDTRQKIDSLLTPAQRERYHALLARIEQDRRVRRGPGPR